MKTRGGQRRERTPSHQGAVRAMATVACTQSDERWREMGGLPGRQAGGRDFVADFTRSRNAGE